MTRRPYLTARPYVWLAADGTGTPGVALMDGQRSIKAHLTADEARTLADKLHDLTDAAGNPQERLPTTEVEQE